MSRPRLTIIAGANGSGKTTLTGWNWDVFHAIPVLDPDAIARTLQPTSRAAFPIAAARQVLASAKEHIDKRESFAVETTLSGRSYLRLMLDAEFVVSMSCCYTSVRKVLRSTWLESEIECSRVAMMFRRAMSAGVTSEASRVFSQR